MKGSYCILMQLHADSVVAVGALGRLSFQRGVYAYVGSAQSGIEARVARHMRARKKKRWHIDYLLSKAEVLSVIAIPSPDKGVECRVAEALLEVRDASAPVPRFGSSDCRCSAHLIFFGDAEPQMVAEDVAMRIAMLQCIYPEKTAE